MVRLGLWLVLLLALMFIALMYDILWVQPLTIYIVPLASAGVIPGVVVWRQLASVVHFLGLQ